MAESFKISIAGLGTVGTGVVEIIQKNQDLLAARCGRAIEIVSVSAADQSKDRGVDLSSYTWANSIDELAKGADCVVELVGGSEGFALDLTRYSLNAGKHVVTANKAMVAHHGFELASLAEAHDVSLAYEAAVAGGVPIIKGLREGLAANRVSGVYGILNGTCNYILTQMRETGRDFDDVLKDAQELGYAEADPSFDVEGVDAGHKICLLASLAFGVKPRFERLQMRGIRSVTSTDIAFASEFGCKIKLLGIARMVDGKINMTVEPCLVPKESPMAAIEGVYNAVLVDGDFVDTPLFTGRGAGKGPTASAVMADIIDLARGLRVPTFGVAASALKEPEFADPATIMHPYYIRLTVLDQPGVIAAVSAILRDRNISIESMLQKGRDPDQPVSVVLTTHDVPQGDVVAAVEAIAKLDIAVEPPSYMRVESEL